MNFIFHFYGINGKSPSNNSRQISQRVTKLNMGEEDENIISILVASDIHLGYKERDPILGKDSFTTFNEIFKIAKEKNVDFMLFGGDLFHENKPSRKCLHTAMETMRRYCLGSRPCQVQVISDQSVNFGHTSCSITSVNYEDPNLNIAMPVFSIHGNHDDPTGSNDLSAIDIISVAGLLNHFGKPTSLDKIKISPVLLQKGSTKLALYGLGSMRDERLHRLFTGQKVEVLRPCENQNEWYNMMVLHQNRSAHGPTNYIPEHFLEEFFDVVVWGHEHECRITPEYNAKQNFYVIQPGSPVATSLCPGESKTKHVAVVKIRGREMKCEPIRLNTVRQMFVEDVVLSECPGLPASLTHAIEEKVQMFLEEKVEMILKKAEKEHTGHAMQPTKPLIRLRVDISGGYPTFSACRFGNKFVQRVANPDKIIRFIKKQNKNKNGGTGIFDVKEIDDIITSSVKEKILIEDLVKDFFLATKDDQKLEVLSPEGLTEALRLYVHKNESSAMGDICDHQIKKTKQYLQKLNTVDLEKTLEEEVSKLRLKREAAKSAKKNENSILEDDNLEEIVFMRRQERSEARARGDLGMISDGGDSDESNTTAPLTIKARGRGRGSRGGKGSRGRGSRGGRGKKAQTTGKRSFFETTGDGDSKRSRINLF